MNKNTKWFTNFNLNFKFIFGEWMSTWFCELWIFSPLICRAIDSPPFARFTCDFCSIIRSKVITTLIWYQVSSSYQPVWQQIDDKRHAIKWFGIFFVIPIKCAPFEKRAKAYNIAAIRTERKRSMDTVSIC